MPDVGDGLAMSVTVSEPEASMQIDWGGYTGKPKKKPREAYEAHEKFWGPEPTTFVLSHFHFDHYKGLTYAAHEADIRDQFEFDKACYPRLPDFVDFWNKQQFARALEAANIRLALTTFGDDSGLPSYDFLVALQQISSYNVYPRALYRGQEFTVGGESFDVLWPPFEITKERARSAVEDARESVDDALEGDPLFEEIYRGLREGKIERETHIGDQGETPNQEGIERRTSRIRESLKQMVGRIRENPNISADKIQNIPEVTQDAADDLRDAADDLSLVFKHKEKSLLFLGDHYAGRLNDIAKKLEERGDTHYSIMVSSHHGTRVGKQGKNGIAGRLSGDIALSSVGDELKDGLQPLYSKLARLHLTTLGNGDIHAGDWTFFNPFDLGPFSPLHSWLGPSPNIALKKRLSSPKDSTLFIKCEW